MQLWERFTVSTGIAIGEPGDLPALFGGNDTGLSEADLLNAGDLLPMDHPQRDEYINQGFRLVEVEDPNPPRREIPKSTVQARLSAVGKFDAVFAILLAQPIYFGRWFAPDWPNVFFDDADMLMLLAAAGCTSEEIADITAPL